MTNRFFPPNRTAMASGYEVKPNFTVESEKEIAKPPKVQFGSAPGQFNEKATTK